MAEGGRLWEKGTIKIAPKCGVILHSNGVETRVSHHPCLSPLEALSQRINSRPLITACLFLVNVGAKRGRGFAQGNVLSDIATLIPGLFKTRFEHNSKRKRLETFPIISTPLQPIFPPPPSTFLTTSARAISLISSSR